MRYSADRTHKTDEDEDGSHPKNEKYMDIRRIEKMQQDRKKSSSNAAQCNMRATSSVTAKEISSNTVGHACRAKSNRQ